MDNGLRATIVAALSFSVILNAHASTLFGRSICQLNEEQNAVIPVSFKSDSYPFHLLGAAANIVLAIVIIAGMKDEKKSSNTIASAHQDINGSTNPVRQKSSLDFLSDPGGDIYSWVNSVLGYESILLYGAPGSGKTSTGAWFARERLNMGHDIFVLDPHATYGKWVGLDVVGSGMDYAHIDKCLLAFKEEVRRRYVQMKEGPFDPQPMTIILDEFTNWSERCENSGDFLRECMTDTRKVNIFVIIIGHTRNLAGLGGAKASGLGGLRDAALLEIELKPQADPNNAGRSFPSGKGTLKMPGEDPKEAITIDIPEWMNGSMDFTEFFVENLEKQVQEQD